MYNTKNYQKQGGSEWVVGGSLVIKASGTLAIEEGATITGLPTPVIPVAENVALAVGETPTKAEFNALVTALITAGIVAAAE